MPAEPSYVVRRWERALKPHLNEHSERKTQNYLLPLQDKRISIHRLETRTKRSMLVPIEINGSSFRFVSLWFERRGKFNLPRLLIKGPSKFIRTISPSHYPRYDRATNVTKFGAWRGLRVPIFLSLFYFFLQL